MKKHISNIITCCNLICGCIATYCAFHHGHQVAFLFILLGAFFDFFDGMTARALGVSGKLGLELDSLADCVTFGVAPSAMLFTLFNHVAYPVWMGNAFFFNVMPFTAFLMAAFSALRLAKFNIDERQHTSFIGMPTPANAIFWGALISSSEAWLTGPRFNALFLFLFMILSCWCVKCPCLPSRVFLGRRIKSSSCFWECPSFFWLMVPSAADVLLMVASGQGCVVRQLAVSDFMSLCQSWHLICRRKTKGERSPFN